MYFQLCILVAGALGGRFDHEIGNINVLCRFSTIRIILISDDCLIHLLPRTHHHEIHIQPTVEGPHCGLIPIGMPSGSTTTTGLQWDLGEYFLWQHKASKCLLLFGRPKRTSLESTCLLTTVACHLLLFFPS